MAAVSLLVATPDTGNTPNTSGSFTPATGDLLVVFISTGGSTSVSSNSLTASANGITFSPDDVVVVGGSATLTTFIADQHVGINPQAMTVTWTPSDPGTCSNIVVLAVSGMERAGSSAIRQSNAGSNSAGTTPQAILAGNCLTTNPVIFAVGNATNPATITPPASPFAELSDIGNGSPTTGTEVAAADSGFTSATVTAGGTSASAWGAVAVELDASAYAGPDLREAGDGGGNWDNTTGTTLWGTVNPVAVGDRITIVMGGDGGVDGANAVTASAITRSSGATIGPVVDVIKELPAGGATGWLHIATTTATSADNLNMQGARTQSGTARGWGGMMIITRGDGGIGDSTFVDSSATEVGSLDTTADSLVAMLWLDWDNVTVPTGAIPTADEFDLERAARTGYTVVGTYWRGQAAGTRDYGTNASTSTNIRIGLVEIRAAGAGGPSGDATIQQRSTTDAAAGPKVSIGASMDEQRSVDQAAGAKSTSGAATDQQRSTTDAVSGKVAIGTGQVAQRSAVVSTGSLVAPSVSGDATDQQRSATVAASIKVGVGSNEVVQRSTIVAAGAKIPTAAATTEQHSSTDATGIRTGIGAASAEQHSVTVSTGQATAAETHSGSAAVEQRSTVTAAGAEVAVGAGSIDQRSVTVAAGLAVAAGAAVDEQHAVTVATGFIVPIGVFGPGEVVQRSTTTAAGVHIGIGAGSIDQHSVTDAAGTKTSVGAATGQQRTTTDATGFIVPTGVFGPGVVQQRSTIVATGQKIAVTGESDEQHSTTTATGAMSATGAAIDQQRTETIGAGARTGIGAASVQQRSTTDLIGIASSGISGSATMQQRSAVVATGVKIPVVDAVVSTRTVTIAGAGTRLAIGGGIVTIHTMTAASALRTALGAATIQQHSTTDATLTTGRVGTASIQQRSQTRAVRLGDLTGLRIRRSGRETLTMIAGNEPTTVASGTENSTALTGQEEGTLI